MSCPLADWIAIELAAADSSMDRGSTPESNWYQHDHEHRAARIAVVRERVVP